MINGGSPDLIGVAIVFTGFLLDWLSVSLGWKKIRPYAKVAALIILIVWTLAALNFEPGPTGWLLILALVFGLTGDILLLFPNRCFIWGLGAFLLGHITYLGLFYILIRNSCELGLASPIPPWAWMGLAGVIAVGFFLFYTIIIRQMQKPRPTWFFQAALYLYAVCLTSVAAVAFLAAGFLAVGQWVFWALPLGGILFFISDFILAFNRFVRPVHLAHLWIMTSYHLAQFFLAVGFLTFISLF